MARCLDLSSRIHSIDDAEITAAFERAAAGKPALLSCFDHDYRDIADRVGEFQARLAGVARGYPGVPWRYAAPVEASRAWLGAAEPPPLRLEVGRFGGEVRIWAEEPLFQSIPWIAIRGREGGVRHVEEGVVRVDGCRWVWRPPDELDWEEAAVAGSTWLGRSATARVERGGSGSRLSPLAAGRHPTRPRSIWEHSTLFRELCVERADGATAEMDSVKQAVALLEGKVAPGDSVLDAGCAAGHAWRSLSRLGLEYHGIDAQTAAIEIGRGALGRQGLPPERLRNLELEALPPGESYDIVLCLSTLGYMPDFRGPLEVLARAARRLLLVRSGFGEDTRIRYLPDVLLDPPHQAMRAYFNVWARRDVEDFLEVEGFVVKWVDDVRQAERFDGRAEVVGGIELPNSWLVAERVRPAPAEEELLGDELGEMARRWREERSGFERS